MEQYDNLLKRMAHEENTPLPPWASACIEDALASLPQKRKRRGKVLRYFGTAMAACLAIFIALPNLSAQAADVLQALPLVGPLVEIVTFRTYTQDTENHHAMVEIPTVEGQSDNPVYNESIQAINEDVEALTSTLIAQFEADAAALGEEAHTALEVRHRVVTNSDTWFTLEMEIWLGSGSSNTYYRYYHLDKTTGEIMELPDLFRNDGYIQAISEEILRQMRAANDAGTGVFWIDSEYEGLNFQSIDPEQNFYFDENGDLVIVFNKYEVAPGSSGCPTFTIPRAVYEAYLQ